MEIITFVKDFWTILVTLFGLITYLTKQVLAMRKGLRAMLRADIIRLYNKYHDDLEYCPLYVKQALEEEYKEYHKIGGNGVGTKMYEELMALPTEKEELYEKN